MEVTNVKTDKFRTLVAVELARRGMRQRDLARLLQIPDTTLSDWLRGAHPAPADLAARVERSLRLPTGFLGKEA
jgi:predicted transcriptional regulator